jgi:hypothetical protein
MKSFRNMFQISTGVDYVGFMSLLEIFYFALTASTDGVTFD